MRFYVPAGRRSGISLGPLGLLIVGPIILAVLLVAAMFWVCGALLVGILRIVVAALAARKHRRAVAQERVLPPTALPERESRGVYVKRYEAPESERVRLGSAQREARVDEVRKRLKID